MLTISLDFELHWGGFEKWPLSNYKNYFLTTRETIPRMLDMFAQYGIHVTWAAVGLLLHRNRKELDGSLPALKPTYKEAYLSAYHFIDQQGIGQSEHDDPFHYAFSLAEQIVKTPYQELGSHTFGHYYTNEEGQTPEQFRADLKSAHKAASVFGVNLKSLVFPRNQFNDQYLRVCFEEGFESVRSNPPDWFWKIGSAQHESFWKRLNRGVDAYFPIGKENTYLLSDIEAKPGYPVCLPASRLLRPYRPQEGILNTLKVDRILGELTGAARSGKVYHLWWHPHNFGNYPNQSLAGLKRILNGFMRAHDGYGMRSMSMGELARLINADL